MKATHNICIEINSGVIFEYAAYEIQRENENDISYCRIDDGAIQSNKGMLYLSLATKMVMFTYDILSIEVNIVNTKQDGESIIYECTADSLRVSVKIDKIAE